MELKRTDRLFRFMYGGLTSKKGIPKQVTIFGLFLRLFWMTFISWPLYAVTLVAVMIVIAFVVASAFLFSYTPVQNTSTKDGFELHPRWPTIAGWRVWPISVLTGLWFLYKAPVFIGHVVANWKLFALMIGIAFGVLILRGVMIWLVMGKNYILSKSEKFNPVISIEPPSEERGE